jgi:hypothetical protein
MYMNFLALPIHRGPEVSFVNGLGVAGDNSYALA